MAEIELGVLARQCLDRRIPDQQRLKQETRAWWDQRNRDSIRVDWRFTTQDARIKSPSIPQSNTDGLLGYPPPIFADPFLGLFPYVLQKLLVSRKLGDGVEEFSQRLAAIPQSP